MGGPRAKRFFVAKLASVGFEMVGFLLCGELSMPNGGRKKG